MTLTVASLVMFAAIVHLLLAAIGVPGFARWSWFPAGMFLWACSLFLSVNVH